MYQSSVNQEKIQIINRSLILNLLRQEGICSRATLARLSGLRQATITNIAGELIRCGLVVETGLIAGAKNRRSIGIQLNDARYKVVGVRMERHMFHVGLMGISGELYGIWQHHIEPEENLPAILGRIRAAVQEIVYENPDTEILSTCVAVPGPYQEKEDRLLFVTGMDGWQNCSIRELLSIGLGIPVHVINDANAGAFAQFWYHCQDPAMQDLVYILAGQGIGCGIMVDGKLLLGQRGIAGEFGHSSIRFDGTPCACGNRGCLEKYSSMAALREQIKEQLRCGASSCLHEDRLTVQAISHAVHMGDRVACEAYRQVCHFLATGIVGLINQLNPGRIIIGEELAKIDPNLLLDVVQSDIDRCVNPLAGQDIAVEVNRLPESPSLLGAGAYAAYQMLSNPEPLLMASGKTVAICLHSRGLA